MGIQYISTALFVNDIISSKAFYVNILGQTIEYDHGECVAFHGGFSLWEKTHAHGIIFGQSVQEQVNQAQHRSCELYFESTQLDDVLQRLVEQNIEFVHALKEQPWGQRAFRIYDLDKHIIEIGEPMHVVIRRFLNAGLTAEAVSKRTSMPLDAVLDVMQPECVKSS